MANILRLYPLPSLIKPLIKISQNFRTLESRQTIFIFQLAQIPKRRGVALLLKPDIYIHLNQQRAMGNKKAQQV